MDDSTFSGDHKARRNFELNQRCSHDFIPKMEQNSVCKFACFCHLSEPFDSLPSANPAVIEQARAALAHMTSDTKDAVDQGYVATGSVCESHQFGWSVRTVRLCHLVVSPGWFGRLDRAE